MSRRQGIERDRPGQAASYALSSSEEAGFPGPSPGGGLGEAKVKSAIVSELHTAVLSEDGRLFTWGSNSFGNLGYAECEPLSESATRSTSAGGSLCQRVPRQVIGGGLGTRRVVAICSSDYSTLCATYMGLRNLRGLSGECGYMRVSGGP